MSYNKYTPRKAQRYNSPGTFVPAGSFGGGPRGGYGNMGPPRQPEPVQTFNKPITQNSEPNFQTPMNPPPQVPPQLLETPTEQESMETNTSEVKPDVADVDAPAKPFWMKSKLVGVKKISNKERRRRQNENLRRLLTPKNALMVLNEIMSGEQLANQFKVCAVPVGAQYYKPALSSFCAELDVDGQVYMGYGETKMVARHNAAEQAIRDLMIKRMEKLFAEAARDHEDGEGHGAAQGGPVEDTGSVPGVIEGEGEKEAAEALPMIQLASYALHKLFTEWECEGHKVPQLKPYTVSETNSEATEIPTGPNPTPPPAKSKSRPPRVLPPHAATMHPCMLLTHMRPQLEYRELAALGDSSQNMLFTLAVDVDGVTYVGKAGNKKEARKAAARAACEDIFKVKFEF